MHTAAQAHFADRNVQLKAIQETTKQDTTHEDEQPTKIATRIARTISLFYFFMFSCTHFQGSWMAQEKHRKSVGGYGAMHGEEAIDLLHCPRPREQAAETSA